MTERGDRWIGRLVDGKLSSRGVKVQCGCGCGYECGVPRMYRVMYEVVVQLLSTRLGLSQLSYSYNTDYYRVILPV